jgi:hypothetical protein
MMVVMHHHVHVMVMMMVVIPICAGSERQRKAKNCRREQHNNDILHAFLLRKICTPVNAFFRRMFPSG